MSLARVKVMQITDPDDPRIADYREVRERDLVGRRGLFVAEGEVVLRALVSVASRHRPVSALIAAHRVDRLAPLLATLPAEAPVYAADQPVMDAIAGFPIHRGVLALGEIAAAIGPTELLAGAAADAVVIALCGIGNHDNMGGIFRNAAAFGVQAVLLDDQCCDPLYRKAIRVSVGAALRVPTCRFGPADSLPDLLASHGFEAVALSPSAPEPLHRYRPGGPAALLLGAEGPGLPPAVLARCRAVSIPMAGGFDSLNVAATSAVALHQLRFGGV